MSQNPGATVETGTSRVTYLVTDDTTVFTFTNKRVDKPWVYGKDVVTNGFALTTQEPE